jgi:hypothetical protein
VAAFQPTHTAVDEDATPLPRIVLAAARNVGASSEVRQHGACGVRFGFAPLLADRIVVRDAGSQAQLLEWGVERHRIELVESQYSAPSNHRVSGRPGKILLLGTTPPRDDRPDAVTYHLTTRTYAEMLDTALAAVDELAEVELVVRRHPRAAHDPTFDRIRRRYPNLRVCMSRRRERLSDLVAAADCVLSCASSAGIEAARAGRPVIQLLPAGSGNVLPAEWYGLRGSARSLKDLRELLPDALSAAEPVYA